MKAYATWIGANIKPKRFSPIKKELTRTLQAGETLKRIDFGFSVAGVVFNHEHKVLMDNNEWMPVVTLYTDHGVLVGPSDLTAANGTKHQEIWRNCLTERIKDSLGEAMV